MVSGLSWLRELEMVELSGEREDDNRILHSLCSLLVVECCVGWVLCYRFWLYACYMFGCSCGFCLLHVI